jgi:hypothetical protein
VPLSNPLAATVADLSSLQNALYATGVATYPAAAAAGDGISLAEVLRYVQYEAEAIEDHFHNRELWFGKLASQTATDWADNTLTPYRAISGSNAYGADANDEALVWGTADAVLLGQTLFDMHELMVVASSVTSIYKLRIVYGSGTMADAITAGQYSEIMAVVASASSRIAQQEIRMPRLTIGTDQVWIQAWNATNNATIDFFVGLHGYAS